MEIKNFFSKTELQKNGKLYDVFSLFNLIKIKRRKHLIYQGVESLFGKRRVLFVHFEFTSVCNRQCSYCLENNGNPNKIKEAWSDENKVLSAVEKIFALANETDFVFFIIAGGEPTLQPAFIKLVEKIKSYRNGGCLVTTNLTQSIEYYQQLDIPICTSLHLENNDVDQYLKKVKELKNLIAHVRLMAPPHMVPQIQAAFKKLKQLNQTDHISFAVERLYSFGDQIITYPPEELKEISKLGYYDAEYPESLKQKMGPAEDIFYRFFWFYKNNKKKEGAGDQGIIFGYATNELSSAEYMPATLYFSHKILKELSRMRRAGEIKWLRPDAKSQVTLRYENGKPIGVDTVVVSTQHTEDVSYEEIKTTVHEVVHKILPEGWSVPEEKFYVNPTGRFVIGGPDGDTGLTGRKIIVDTYGGAVAHGGGAFSGKDPTKVDRSAAYATRYLAKNIVAAGLADRAMIQIAYAIGIAKPVAVYLDTFGTCKVDENKLEKLLPEVMKLSPRGIRTHLQLNRPIYTPTSSYGHFGRVPGEEGAFPWEKTDLVEILKREF